MKENALADGMDGRGCCRQANALFLKLLMLIETTLVAAAFALVSIFSRN